LQNKWQTINRGAATLGRVNLWVRAAAYCAKVLQLSTSPDFSPVVSTDALRRRGTVVPDSFTHGSCNVSVKP